MPSAMRKMAVYLGLVEDDNRYQDKYDSYGGEYEDYDESGLAEGTDEAEVGALRGLRRRLGVAVLAEIPHAEPVQQPDVGGGEGLGHRDQRDVLRLAARGCASGRDTFPYRGEPRGEFVPAGEIGHLRKSGTSRSSSSSKTTGRRRVLATSKVLPSSACAGREMEE